MEFDLVLSIEFEPFLQNLTNTKQETNTVVYRIQRINKLKEWFKKTNNKQPASSQKFRILVLRCRKQNIENDEERKYTKWKKLIESKTQFKWSKNNEYNRRTVSPALIPCQNFWYEHILNLGLSFNQLTKNSWKKHRKRNREIMWKLYIIILCKLD